MSSRSYMLLADLFMPFLRNSCLCLCSHHGLFDGIGEQT